MDNIRPRATSLPPSLPAARKVTVTPVTQQSVSRPSSQPPAQPYQEPSKFSKKRRNSESEPPDAKLQQQVKKPRKQDPGESLPKKPVFQATKQDSHQPSLRQTYKPSHVQTKSSKEEPIPSKP
ncbi:hypothetical protein KCU72_g20116, partial [Aureobasidium melanogenum]